MGGVPAIAPGTEGMARPAPEGAGPAYAKSEPVRPGRNGLIPAGEACLTELNERGIVWQARKGRAGRHDAGPGQEHDRQRAILLRRHPVHRRLPAGARSPELAPELEAQGVTQVRFSGAYVYRTRRSGTLSLHANGLAIDIHDVWFGSERLSVKKDFARGQGRECRPGMARLNVLACRVREARLFKELLTPDDNADHHDHFHFGVARLPGEVPAEPPVILKQPVRKGTSAAHEGHPVGNRPARTRSLRSTTACLEASAEEPAAPEEPAVDAHDEHVPEVQHPGSLPEILPESLEH